MTGAAKNTVVKLLRDVGRVCEQYHDRVMAKRIQVDEIWSFCYAKQKNVPPELQGQFGYGDVWTWSVKIEKKPTSNSLVAPLVKKLMSAVGL